MLLKNYVAGGAIPAYTPVKFNGTPGQVVAAVLGTDKVVGVTTDTDAVQGERVDVIHSGEAKVLAGAAFAAGDLLMSDATSRAIVAAAAAGSNVRTFALAREAASAAGDICEVLIQPGSFQG